MLLLIAGSTGLYAQNIDDVPSRTEVAEASSSTAGSPYIPVDSWMYSAAIRLHELGYIPTAYVGMRPWTRASLANMLKLSQNSILNGKGDNEATEIFDRLHRELAPEFALADASAAPTAAIVESVYTRIQGIDGNILNDSYHFGQTLINDYGRPYQPGFNNLTGYSARGTTGRFSLYVRGEYQHAPSGTGYSTAVDNYLDSVDNTPQGTQFGVPQPTIPAQNNMRLLEANISAHLIGHEISFGKSDAWLGPGQGASMGWSNNAENIYSFRINHVEPLYIPFLSRLTGLFRYDFMVGSLKGHVDPNDPWIHAEKFSLKPTSNVEFGFERSVIWGGKGHVPITIHTFLRSFFRLTADQNASDKFSRNDPGARFSTFDLTYCPSWWNHLLTVYTDSLVHDNVFPVSNPGRNRRPPPRYLFRSLARP